MKVLIACEFSGIVREAFKAKGHDAWSCDLLPTEIPGQHIQGDVLEILNDGWDMMIAHPPCTHLCVSGAAWFKNKKKEQAEAIEFFARLLFCTIEKICVENPIGIISTVIKPPTQIIEPYYFGDPVKKPTCLWLKNLQPLLHIPEDTLFDQKTLVNPEMITMQSKKTGRIRTYSKWEYENGCKNYYDGTRAKDRSKTFPGIANAMAEQWG